MTGTVHAFRLRRFQAGLHDFWYAFGDHDAYCLWEAPDNVSMAAVSIAISAGGALSEFHTTTLQGSKQPSPKRTAET